MSALPMHPTECDRERFRDLTKAMGYPLEYARCGQHEAYSDAITHMVFEVWWKAERERQLLQNLNMSQGCKLSELGAELEKVTTATKEYIACCDNSWRETCAILAKKGLKEVVLSETDAKSVQALAKLRATIDELIAGEPK